MAFDIEQTLHVVNSYLRRLGTLSGAQIGEPKDPPEDFYGCVFMRDTAVAELTLASTIEVHSVFVRIYMNMLRSSQNPAARPPEAELARAVSKTMQDFAEDADLGSTVRNVDLAGQHGTAMGARWGYAEVGGTVYRIADITVPLIVDGSASQAL